MSYSLNSSKAFVKKWRYLYKKRTVNTTSKGRLQLAIITGQLAAGGVETVLLNIIKGLPKNSFEVTIYVTDFSNNSWLYKFEDLAKVVHINKVVDWASDPKLVTNFLEVSLVTTRPDVIFITNSTSGYEALKRSMPLLKVIQRTRVYDLLHTHGRPQDDDAFLKISEPYDKLITSRIVINEYLKKYLINHYGVEEKKVKVIYNGLVSSSVAPNIAHGRETLSLTGGQKAISFIGRLQSDKSPIRLVYLAHIQRTLLETENTVLCIVGEGELKDEMLQLSESLKLDERHLKFIGYSDTPLDIMAASRFTLLTSDLEGIPMSILESMDIGVPSIAPAVGGIPEIIQDGVSGILAPFSATMTEDQKIESLANGIKRALSMRIGEVSDMRKHAMLSIESRFKKMESEYIALFSK